MSGEASAAPTAVREVVKALCVCLGGGGIEGSDGVVASEMAALLDGGCVASTPSTAAPEAKEAKKEEAEEEDEGSDWDDWDESDEELEKSSGGVDAAQAEVGALLWWLGQSGRPLLLEAASGVSEADGAKLVAAMQASGGRSEAVDVS